MRAAKNASNWAVEALAEPPLYPALLRVGNTESYSPVQGWFFGRAEFSRRTHLPILPKLHAARAPVSRLAKQPEGLGLDIGRKC